jgi:uncharacterized protein (TIGR03118 family)
MSRRALLTLPILALLLAGLAGPATAGKNANSYHRTKLVSDQPGEAAHQDPNLVNAWGLAAGPTTPWWVADNGTDKSTLYDGTGTARSLVVDVPGAPTGLVFNGTPGFVVTDGTNSGASLFIFSTEAGTIRGWSPGVPPPPPSTQTEIGADRSSVGAIYKGLAIDAAAGRLYATDFHNNRVDVFDSTFQLLNLPGAFVDPKLPPHFAPFGIQDIDGTLFVTYAKQDADAEDDLHGRSLGFVDMFDTSGVLLGRVATRGQLNAPWGLVMASDGFGRFAGDLLVGNFGDGQINAYEQRPNGSFAHRGRLRNENGKPLTVDGLWGLGFGNDVASGSPDTLYFTAGPDDESHGLFGSIDPTG